MKNKTNRTLTQMESGFSIDPVPVPVNVSELVCPLQMGQHMSV